MSDGQIRVLYDHQIFAIQRFGGISRIFVELARRLSARPDASVSWYRGYHVDQYDVSDFQRRLARYWSLEQAPLGTGTWTRERINLHGLRLFSKTMLRGAEVYHPSYYDPNVASLVRSRRVAITVYDMIPERFQADVERFRSLLAGKRTLVDRADVIFVISECTRRDLVDILHVDPRRTVLAYPASDMAGLTADPLPDELKDRPYLLYVGTRSRHKNFTVLQEAFARSERLRRDLRVVCFGGAGGFVEPERTFLAEHGLSHCFVHLTGNDSLLKSLYQHAQALVYTSRFEGFGMPPLEAMETGCPVICCPVSSLPEVVVDAALYFDPDSPDELVERIHLVLDDSTVRDGLVAHGLARARRFSWDEMVERTLAGYRMVL